MTRPLIILGVPFLWLMLELGICIITFLLLKKLITIVALVVMHVAGLLLTKQDQHFMSIIKQRVRTGICINSRIKFGGDSYAP